MSEPLCAVYVRGLHPRTRRRRCVVRRQRAQRQPLHAGRGARQATWCRGVALDHRLQCLSVAVRFHELRTMIIPRTNQVHETINVRVWAVPADRARFLVAERARFETRTR
jgi:hypothetical protein